MALPSADATLALYLVDEEHLVDAEIAALIAVYRHLQKCEFTEAWAALKAVTATALGKKFLSKEGGAALKGFETALRKCMLEMTR